MDVRPCGRAGRYVRCRDAVLAGEPEVARQMRAPRGSAGRAAAGSRTTSHVDVEWREIEDILARTEERGRFADLLNPSVRPALIVGIGLAVFQQVTGINTVIYYAPLIIQSAGYRNRVRSDSGDRGRRRRQCGHDSRLTMWLLDTNGSPAAPPHRHWRDGPDAGCALGLAFRNHAPTQASAEQAVISMMVYVAAFAIGLGPIFWLLISEIYPLSIRSSTEGLAAAFNWGSNLVVSLTFLTLVQELGATRTFWLYGVLAVAAWIFSYYRVPETKGRTLEEIEAFWHVAP